MRILPHSRRSETVAPRPFCRSVVDERAGGALPVIVVVALEFEVADDRLGRFVAPVRQQHDVIAIEGLRIAGARLDDDRAVQAASVPETPNGCDTSRCRSDGRGKR